MLEPLQLIWQPLLHLQGGGWDTPVAHQLSWQGHAPLPVLAAVDVQSRQPGQGAYIQGAHLCTSRWLQQLCVITVPPGQAGQGIHCLGIPHRGNPVRFDCALLSMLFCSFLFCYCSSSFTFFTVVLFAHLTLLCYVWYSCSISDWLCST